MNLLTICIIHNSSHKLMDSVNSSDDEHDVEPSVLGTKSL